MNIKLCNLTRQYEEIKDEILKGIDEVLSSSSYIQGIYVKNFEEAYSRIYNNQFVVGCSNGTSAIHIALKALNIGNGDEVITTAMTFIATVEGIIHAGAKPVLVDIDKDTYQIDVEQIESKITNKTKAIIPVHLYGNVCDMDKIIKIAKKYDLKVIEDCAQAHLAVLNQKLAGTFGDAATFSFYPAKNLGAYGDAGAMIFKDKSAAQFARMFLDHGRIDKYTHEFIGYNYRMADIQAKILEIKLKYLNKWTKRRQEIAKKYNEAFIKNGIKTMKPTTGSTPVYHLFTIEVDNRDLMIEKLKNKNIATVIHYPKPLNEQKALKDLGITGYFLNAKKVSQRILSLPIFPEMTDEEVNYVIEGVLN